MGSYMIVTQKDSTSQNPTEKPSFDRKAYMKVWNKAHGMRRWARERKEIPWKMHYMLAKARCNNPRNASYKYYGAKGIRFLLSKEEIKHIWLRDNAQGMLKPTIDRYNSSHNYELYNCRFIEQKENSARSGEKKVTQYTKDNKLVAIYKSMVSASRATGIGVSNIMGAANVNSRSKYAGGYLWVKTVRLQ